MLLATVGVVFVLLLCGCPEEIPELTVSLDATYSVNAGEDLAIQANVSGGTPPYQFTWEVDGQERDSIVSGLLYLSDATEADDGYLRVTVVDQDNAIAFATAIVDVVGEEVEEGQDEGETEGVIEGELQPVYTLTTLVEPVELAGTVLTSTPNLHLAGEVVDIWVITPNGYSFSHWLGNVANPDASNTTVTMTGNETIVAVFEKVAEEGEIEEGEVVEGEGTEEGQIEGSEDGEEVMQITVPDFSNLGWLDASVQAMQLGLIVDNGTSHCSDTVADDHVITHSPAAGTKVDPGTEINFVISSGPCTVPTYTLTTEVIGDEGGHIEVSPVADEYAAGTQVTFKAVADEDWVFGGWFSDDVAISHMTSPLAIPVNYDMTVRAIFYRVVPDFTGMDMFDALLAAVDAGLQTDSESYACSDTVAAFAVLSQSLTAGNPIIGQMPVLHLVFSSGPCTIEGEEEGQEEGEPEGVEEGEVEGQTEGEGAEEGEIPDPCLNPDGLTATIKPNTLIANPGDEIIVELRVNRATCLIDMFGFLISFDQELEMIQDEAAIDGWEVHADSVPTGMIVDASDLTPATPTTFPSGAFYFFAVRIPEDATPGELNFTWGVGNFFMDVDGEEINVELFDGMIEILPIEEEGEGEGTTEGEGQEEGEWVTVPTLTFNCPDSNGRLGVGIQLPVGGDLHDYLVNQSIGEIAYIGMSGPHQNWVWDPATSPSNPDVAPIVSADWLSFGFTTSFEPWSPAHFYGTPFAVDTAGNLTWFALNRWSASFGTNDEVIVLDGSGGQIIEFTADSGGCE